MKTISVINYKGGVGKTTVTANLGAELAYRGYRVLLLDLDPQASLTFSFIKPEVWGQEFEEGRTIKSWYDSFSSGNPQSLAELIVPIQHLTPKADGKLDLIPSHLGLINVDLELATELGGPNLKTAKRNYIKVHRRLADGLGAVRELGYHFVLIDCPPNFNIVTKTAIVASDGLLVPAKADYLSTMGIDYLLRSVTQLVTEFNDFAAVDAGVPAARINPRVLGVVFTMVRNYGQQPIAAAKTFIAQTRRLDVPVFDSYIRHNDTIFADAPQYGVPVVASTHAHPTHKEIVNGLQEFVSEFLHGIEPVRKG
jgi:chromosome partitioning protein